MLILNDAGVLARDMHMLPAQQISITNNRTADAWTKHRPHVPHAVIYPSTNCSSSMQSCPQPH
jgi:hypothetical protein